MEKNTERSITYLLNDGKEAVKELQKIMETGRVLDHSLQIHKIFNDLNIPNLYHTIDDNKLYMFYKENDTEYKVNIYNDKVSLIPTYLLNKDEVFPEGKGEDEIKRSAQGIKSGRNRNNVYRYPDKHSNDMITSMETIYRELLCIAKNKNSDYTGDNKNPYYNFETTAKLSGITIDQGIFNRMLDKVMRISGIIHKGSVSVKDESLIDSLKDLINYSAIWTSYLENQKSIKGE